MKPKVQGLAYDDTSGHFRIRELEVSITSKCHLRCDNCGFYIPQQPGPALGENAVAELVVGLAHLQRLNIQIGSIAVLGGEPSFHRGLLEQALNAFSKFDNIEQIEVVSHGLTPQNISKATLPKIDKFTISVYFDNAELEELWKNYLQRFAPETKLSLRVDKEWDQWIGDEAADDRPAQEIFDYCWYRKHCVTLERQRLFLCSRIPKLSSDSEGIVLDQSTTLPQIQAYLNRPSFTASCKTCTPMMGLPTVAAGQQPDDRIEKMLPRAITYLRSELIGTS